MDRVPTGRPRILLVEDEPPIARLTAMVLESEGYAVDVVGEQQAAISLLREPSYALVIADTDNGARTSDLSGLAPLIAAAGSRPVLLFTAHRFSPSQIDAAGFAGVVRKPFDIDDLLAAVARALDSVPVAARAKGDGSST